MRLYIDGKYLGECRRHYRDRARKVWVFEMGETVRYRVAAEEIRAFTRDGELRLKLRGILGMLAEDIGYYNTYSNK